jgi:cytochrome c biogenesis protein CcmG/thiol:disulfide interchange protein DsbE
MTDAQNPSTPSPEPAASVPKKLTPARWLVGAAIAVALGVLAMPWLLGRSTTGSLESPEAQDPPAAGSVCAAKKTPAQLSFTVKDMHGADVTLTDFKGKVILLNYWATWCGPCKVEIPDLVALQDQYRDKGFVVLGVSQDDEPETLRDFASTWKMNYPVLVGRDTPELLDAQGSLWGLPTSYLIGRDGTICTRHLGPAKKADFEREIKALL